MRKQRRRWPFLILPSIGVLALLAVVIFSNFLQQNGSSHAAHASHMQKGINANASVIPMHPMYEMAVKMHGAQASKAKQSAANAQAAQAAVPCLASTTAPLCYSPQQIQTAYGASTLMANNTTGAGETIAIVDAFQSPTVLQDLQAFDQMFGLPDPTLNVMSPFGLTPFNANDQVQTGWAGEIALDVEWAHAMAPGATIDLMLANVQQETVQGQLSALLQVVNFAVQNNIGNVISQSFGTGESCLTAAMMQQADATYQQAKAQNQTVLASAGDNGAAVVQCNAQGTPTTLAQGVNFPASDPFVTSVGGTTLTANAAGNYVSETTWNEAQQGDGATGGGVSTVFAQPAFQANSVKSANRAVGDISFDADPLTSVPVVTSSLMPGQTMIIPIGGTSLGAPLAAGMTALLDQTSGKSLGFLNTALYSLSQNAQAYAQAIHDVQTGNNTFVFLNANNQATTVQGFAAAAGWDSPTGIGTPNIAQLAQVLPNFLAAAG